MRYGLLWINLGAFLGSIDSTASGLAPTDSRLRFVRRICLPDIPTRLHRDIQHPARLSSCVPPSRYTTSTGILTCCPSDAAFAISLGPTNSWLIDIAKKTLIFRRMGISPILRLLVPTFLLQHAPAWVTPLPSQQNGSENAGTSNHNAGENPARRKNKVSSAMMIN